MEVEFSYDVLRSEETTQMSRTMRGMGASRGSARRYWWLLLLATFGLVAQLPAQTTDGTRKGTVELTSRLGRQLFALPDDQGVIDARNSLAADPKSVDLVLKLSKAQAARRQYREAVVTCTQGLMFAPGSADLYLERGHRELGLREFKLAMKDLEQATRLAPEMLDAHYHLGLAHYFLGEFKEAAVSFDRARGLSKSDDSLIDCTNWLYVSLRRANNDQMASRVLARITPEVKNTEPHLYFYLRLLHFYQGLLAERALLPPPPDGKADVEGELSFDTVNYGVGNWHLYHNDRSGAIVFFRDAVKGEAWNSWGFIGSEIELARTSNQ